MPPLRCPRHAYTDKYVARRLEKSLAMWPAANTFIFFTGKIPTVGTFGPDCLGVVGQVPLWIAALVVVLRYMFGPLRGLLLPQWLRTFAAETPDRGNDEEAGGPTAIHPKTWTQWTVCLVLLNITAATVGAMGALVWPGRGQQFLMPVIPSVGVSLSATSCCHVSLIKISDRIGLYCCH